MQNLSHLDFYVNTGSRFSNRTEGTVFCHFCLVTTTRMATFLKLNDKQSFALGKVIKEHNVAITGQAGTGKSFLIRNCVEELDRMDRKRAVLCMTGIGCMQFFDMGATTVH